MWTLKQNFREFMDGMLDNIISDLESRSPEYKAYKKNESGNIDKFDEMIGRMSKEDIDFLKKHEMNVFNISTAEQSYIYYRGYKDCVRLLKIIGVI